MRSIYILSRKIQVSLVLASLALGGAFAPAALAGSASEARGQWLAPDDYIDPIGEGADVAPPLTDAEKNVLSLFAEPTDQELTEMNLAGKYGHLDPRHEIPTALLERAVSYYDKNLGHIANKSFLTVVAFGLFSGRSRMFIVDMSSGKVTKLHVAHGNGSDPSNTGIATRFSNAFGSNASSLGYYKTAETYSGKHGLSLRLDGLSSSNSNVRERAVVVHGADYVYDADIKAGRSAGCLAVSMNSRTKVVKMLKGGSIIYAGVSAD